MVVKKRIVKSKKKSQKKVQQRRSRKKTSKRVSKRRSQRRSRKRVSKKKSPKRSLKVRRSRTKSQKKLIVRRKNSRRRKRSNKKQRGGAADDAYDSNFLRGGSGKRKGKQPGAKGKGGRGNKEAMLREAAEVTIKEAGVEPADVAMGKVRSVTTPPGKGSLYSVSAFKTKRAVDRRLSNISSGLTALAGPALYYGVWYLVNTLDTYIPGLGRTLGLISMGMALQKAGFSNTLVNIRGQMSSEAIERIHSLSYAAIRRIYQASAATEKIIKVISNRLSASKRALMGLNSDSSLYLRFKPEDSVGPDGKTLVAVDVAETNTRFVPIPDKFMIDDAGNRVQVEVLVTRPNIHVKFVGEDDFVPAAAEDRVDLTTIGVELEQEEALFAMANAAILDHPEPATAAAAAAAAAVTVELDEERAEALAANLGLTHMKEYIEGNMDQVVARVKAGTILDLNGVVMEVLEAIKQVQEAATASAYHRDDFADGGIAGSTDGEQSQNF